MGDSAEHEGNNGYWKGSSNLKLLQLSSVLNMKELNN
jgi:hypothetical protein